MIRAYAIVLLIATSAVACPQNLQSVLAKRYAELDAAMKKKDLKAIDAWAEKYVRSDFTYTSRDKHVYKRADFLKGLREQMGSVKSVKRSEQKVGVPTVTGNVLTVKVTSEFQAIVMFDTRELNLTDKSESMDTWVLEGGRWKLKRVVQTKADTQLSQGG